jgi:hypothetical protein
MRMAGFKQEWERVLAVRHDDRMIADLARDAWPWLVANARADLHRIQEG